MSYENDLIFFTGQEDHSESQYIPNGTIPEWNQVAQPVAVPVADGAFSCNISSGDVYGNGYYANQGYGYHHQYQPPPLYQDNGHLQTNDFYSIGNKESHALMQAPSVQVPVQRQNGMKKPKRHRTAFTTNQVLHMENEFSKSPYITRDRRLELSQQIKVNERAIKIWFQNRRMKEKMDTKEVSSSQPNVPLPYYY